MTKIHTPEIRITDRFTNIKLMRVETIQISNIVLIVNGDRSGVYDESSLRSKREGRYYHIIILAPGYVCRCNALMSLLTSNWMSRMHLQLTPNPVNNDAYRQTNSIYRHSKIPPFISIKCCHNNIPIIIIGGYT